MTAKRISKQQKKQILTELEALAVRAGLKISYGDMKFAGLRLKSGLCLFKGRRWLVLGSKDRFEDKINLFKEALQEADFSGEELSPELAEILMLKNFPARHTEKKTQLGNT